MRVVCRESGAELDAIRTIGQGCGVVAEAEVGEFAIERDGFERDEEDERLSGLEVCEGLIDLGTGGVAPGEDGSNIEQEGFEALAGG